MNTTKKQDAVQLLLSDSRGIYIPRDFCTNFDLEAFGLSEDDEDVKCCQAGPDQEWYWDAWNQILDKAKTTTGHVLYQDGDLFLLNYDEMTSEELANFECNPEDIEERKCQELIEELKTAFGVTHYELYKLTGMESDIWTLDCTTYGDYCGSYAEKANSEVLRKSHGEFLEERNEGYGSSMLYFTDESLENASSDELKDLIEQLNSLSGYPVLDRLEACILEQEAFDENWEDWGRADFMAELSKLGKLSEDSEPDNQAIDELFYTTAEKIGEYWRAEGSGLTVYIDVKRVAEAV